MTGPACTCSATCPVHGNRATDRLRDECAQRGIRVRGTGEHSRISEPDAARLLGVHVNTMYRWREGWPESWVKIGTRYHWYLNRLEGLQK